MSIDLTFSHMNQAEAGAAGMEPCCFCYRPTHHWYAPKDVAVCPKCAKEHDPREVPTKDEWFEACVARANRRAS